MNLKNKTNKQLWDMLEKIKFDISYQQLSGTPINSNLSQEKYNINQEIIRREKDEKDKV